MAETIREFLVGLGFKIDDLGLKKFDSGVLRATEPVLKLGAAAAATATAIEVMVERVARQMEDLYYAAQRTNSTAASLMDLAFAARQVGLAGAQGEDLLEGLGRAMRTNPGAEGLLNQLGVQTRDAQGHLVDMRGALDELLKRLETMPRYLALQYGSALGLDPEALNQILNNLPQFLAQQEKAQQSLKDFGVDANNAAAKGLEFSRAVNTLERDIGNLSIRIATDWEPAAKGMVDWLDRLITKFGEWNKAEGGTPGKVASGVAAVGGVVGGLALISRMLGFPWLKKSVTASGGLVGRALGLIGKGALGVVDEIGGPLAILLGSTAPANQGEKDYLRGTTLGEAAPGSTAPANQGGRLPLGVRANNPLNIQLGGKEIVYSSPQYGIEAATRLLQLYAQRGLDTVSQIVSRWSGAGGTDLQSYIADVAKRSGFAPGQHLDLTNPAILQRLEQAMARHEQGYMPYGAGVFAQGIAAAGGVTVNQKTEITVNGSGDPASVGNHVVSEQTRVNGDIVRNLSSVVR